MRGCGQQPGESFVVVEPAITNNAQLLFAVKYSLGHLNDAVQVGGAYDGVHFREFVQQLIAETLGEAARDNQGPTVTPLLILRQFQDGVHRLLDGGLQKPAGIHNQHVRLGGIRHYLHAGLVQKTEHCLAVNQVFGTAK